MKTILQIAKELGIDKQRVYRYIKKNHINEVHQEKGVMYYDKNALTLIQSHFMRLQLDVATSEKALVSASYDVLLKQSQLLEKELESKNRQIDLLQSELAEERRHGREQSDRLAILADTAQRLHAGTIKQIEGGEAPTNVGGSNAPMATMAKRKFFDFLKGKRND